MILGGVINTFKPDQEYRTADGVPVKRGDIVWRVFHHGLVSRNKVSRDTMRVWRMWQLEREMYSTERAALAAALAAAKKRLTKARRDVRRETRIVERLKGRTLRSEPDRRRP